MENNYSVVIPSYNRSEQLMLTLAAFETQSFSHDRFEIVVVDDCSSDDTAQVINDYSPSFILKFLRMDCRSGQGAARNRGVRAAAFENVIFCDSDILVVPQFVQCIDGYSSDEPKQIITGTPNSFRRIYTRYFPDFSPAQKQRCIDVAREAGLWRDEYLSKQQPISFLTRHQLVGNTEIMRKLVDKADIVSDEQKAEFIKQDVARWLLFNAGCLSIKKTFFEEAGGFNESIYRGEDWELGYRLSRAGAVFTPIEETVCFHQDHPASYRVLNRGEAFNKVLFEDFGMDDPEVMLLAIWDSSDDLWKNMIAYKNTLRALKSGDTETFSSVELLLCSACKAASERWD